MSCLLSLPVPCDREFTKSGFHSVQTFFNGLQVLKEGFNIRMGKRYTETRRRVVVHIRDRDRELTPNR